MGSGEKISLHKAVGMCYKKQMTLLAIITKKDLKKLYHSNHKTDGSTSHLTAKRQLMTVNIKQINVAL